NGKLDRKSLPDPDTTELSTKEYVAARNEIELQLVEIWQELLGVDRVGIYDNFFELGGHSLLAVQLISRLQLKGFHIEVKDIFENPIIISISDKLSSLSSIYSVPDNGITVTSDRITPSMVPLVNFDQSELDKLVSKVSGGVSNIQDVYPLSPLQEGIYFHHLMSDKNQGDPYVFTNLLSFSDKEKRNSFIEALQFVVNRHDVLRTCILSEGLPSSVQVVLRKARLSVDNVDLDTSIDVLSQLESLNNPDNQWMDVRIAPLLELKTADDPQNNCCYLMVNLHHLVLDHIGLEKVIAEIKMYLSGEESSLLPPVLYRDFIGHTLHSQSINDSESYFRGLFGNIDEPTYPFGLSNVLGDGSNIKESSIFLPEKLSKELRNVCVRLGMSPAVLFHAAYGIVIGKCSNREHAIFGSLFSGRLQGSLGAADSLGLFINTLPLILDLNQDIGKYLDQVNIRLKELLSHEQTPLSNVQGWSGISNDIALFSAILNYRHSSPLSESEDGSITDLGINVIESKERNNYPFTLNVDDYGVDFKLTAQIDGSIDSDRILVYVKQVLIQLLEGANSETMISVRGLNILSKEEESQLLNVFNNVSLVDYHKDKTVVCLFEEQAIKTPEAIALIFEEKQLTYSELDRRSNQLAHYLRNQGIQSGSSVGICLDRSLDMIIGILGILKSGGVYVPIDPHYPKDRIDYMLKDADIGLVLSSNSSKIVLEYHEELLVLLLDKDWGVISECSINTLSNTLSSEGLAYVIYTSGSTGDPKGVPIRHSSLT
ncbi:condensation domain-containing protein, partial [Aquimarina muelleri]|uniref:condensation domain-containing protein n=1 Tax=Aquimarina muelleri TaxID=279356 RepID=UPI0022488EC2